MSTAWIRITGIILLTGIGFQPIAAERPEPPLDVTIVTTNSDNVDHVQWALERFALAGLELPELTVVFHDDHEPCAGREGLLVIRGEEIVLHECQQLSHRIRRSLLHELVHAWDFGREQLSDQARSALLDLRSLPSWNDPMVEWPLRGCEQAAEIVAWGLTECRVPIASRVGDVGSQASNDLSVAFRVLTGTEPLWAVRRDPDCGSFIAPVAPDAVSD